jgi:hypothetical protein
MAPGSAPNTAPLTQAEASVVGQEMTGEIDAVLAGSSLTELLSPAFPLAPAFTARVGLTSPPLGCATVAPLPPTDSDGDGVPDILTITFQLPDCHFPGSQPPAAVDVTGVITITDPSVVAQGLRVVFDAFLVKATAADGSFYLRRVDGVWQLLASSAGFAATDSTTTRHESSAHGVATLAKAWQVEFAAAQGQVFAPDHTLPSGTLTISGSTARTTPEGSRSFVVETVAPLVRDATCLEGHGIVSGELHLTFTSPRGAAVISIVWNGCGVDPTVTLQSTPAT